MAWRSKLTTHDLAAFNPIKGRGGMAMNRRTLRRTLAAVVAVAAISPLFASDSNGCARHNRQSRPLQQNLTHLTSEFPHH
jgi:hypothetical protein